MGLLLVLNGIPQGACIPLERERTYLGRGGHCDVIINLPSASREHACIIRVHDRYGIEDLGSRNGTYVNDRRVHERVWLKDRDRIRICDSVCSFHVAAPLKVPLELAGGQIALEFPLLDSRSGGQAESSSTIEAEVAPGPLALRSQSTDRLRVLLEISTQLSRTLDPKLLQEKLLTRLFDLFPLAERGLILEHDAGRLHVALARTRWQREEDLAHFSRVPARQCLQTGQGLLSEEGTPTAVPGQPALSGRGKSVMSAPLASADGRAFGVLQLESPLRTRKFTAEELELIVCVASLAAAAIENARYHQESIQRQRLLRDMTVARQMQLGFLPQAWPVIPGYEFFTHYEPALELGGDYYDFVPLPGQRLAIALGDVAGKGIPAALLMAKLSSETRFCLLTEPHLPTAVTCISELLTEQIQQMDGFVTLFVAVLDLKTHLLTQVSAGHVSPLVYRATAGVIEPAMPTDAIGLPLGVAGQLHASLHQMVLDPGDYLVAFTDGVTDAMSTTEQFFRVEGIRTAVQAATGSVREAGERILRAVQAHAAGQRPVDNITLVCVGRT